MLFIIILKREDSFEIIDHPQDNDKKGGIQNKS